MNLGIIGLPQTGKRTLFGLLTGMSAEKAPSRDGISYGTAAVRDPRIDRLHDMYDPKRTRYAEFEIALPPDVQPDTARSADWLNPIRGVDALVHVVRAFEADHVFHVAGNVDPVRDLELVEMEFLLADLALVETRLERLAKESKSRGRDSQRDREQGMLEKVRGHLEAEKALRTLDLTEDERKTVSGLQFLTSKPVVVVFNAGEDVVGSEAEHEPIVRALQEQGAETVFLSAAIEAEIAELDEDERHEFMQDLGIEEPAAHRLSRAAYDALGLISFFTVGPDEVRAWPVRRHATAPEAAGRIHSDIERGFIRADTIPYEDLIAAGSEKAARAENLYTLNGKEYVVKDGDVMEFRFSV